MAEPATVQGPGMAESIPQTRQGRNILSKSIDIEIMCNVHQALELVRALAAHCPSVAESAALWGLPGLLVLSTYLKQGNDVALREAAAAALDAILRLHKIQAVKEVLAKGMRIRGLLDKYGEITCQLKAEDPELLLTV